LTILEKITAAKLVRVERAKTYVPVAQLERSPFYLKTPRSLRSSLLDPEKNGIIAEFKKRSPSKGWLNPTALPAAVAKGYEAVRVSAISVLTEQDFFAGDDRDLIEVVKTVNVPVLRKDFIVDSYQIFETKAIGADVILLIAAILSKEKVSTFSRLAKELGLEVLLEVHTVEELDSCLTSGVDVVGVNNRNLIDFSVNTNTSYMIAPLIPTNFLKVSESGISDPVVINGLKKAGFNGFLIGEAFMREPDPALAIKTFTDTLF